MLHIVLYQPEIPPNTGNIMRLCANTGARLHLVEPLGFVLDDARLKRAGMDYRDRAGVRRYPTWEAFKQQQPDLRLWAFTRKSSLVYSTVSYLPGDALLFGPETRGLPDEVLGELGPDRCLGLPMQEGSRSLNLSNTAAIALYEAWRQLDFCNLDNG